MRLILSEIIGHSVLFLSYSLAQFVPLVPTSGVYAINAPAPAPAPIPPPCTIQTQICTSFSAPFYVSNGTVSPVPRPFNMDNCSISYTDASGDLSSPDITSMGGNQIPCNANVAMKFGTVFGDASVTYNETLGGIPADPFIS